MLKKACKNGFENVDEDENAFSTSSIHPPMYMYIHILYIILYNIY